MYKFLNSTLGTSLWLSCSSCSTFNLLPCSRARESSGGGYQALGTCTQVADSVECRGRKEQGRLPSKTMKTGHVWDPSSAPPHWDNSQDSGFKGKQSTAVLNGQWQIPQERSTKGHGSLALTTTQEGTDIPLTAM